MWCGRECETRPVKLAGDRTAIKDGLLTRGAVYWRVRWNLKGFSGGSRIPQRGTGRV